MIIPIKYELIHFINIMFNQNQNQQPNTFQQVPSNDPFRQQNPNQNPMNMFQNMGQGPNNPGMPGNGCIYSFILVFSPGTFRGVMQNQQFQDNPNIQTYPNKLADDGYQESGLSLQQGARQNFISKVYMLLSIQLLFTTLLGYFAYNS